MRSRSRRPGVRALALALVLNGAWAAAACAAHGTRGHVSGADAIFGPPAPALTPANADGSITTTADSLALGPYHLRRAVDAATRGDLGVEIDELEAIDLGDTPAFEGADRAAFLLGQAYRASGDHTRFAALARHVAAWPRSPYTRWLADLAALDAAGSGALPDTLADADPFAAALAASALLDAGDAPRALAHVRAGVAQAPDDPLLAMIEATALAASGAADDAALARVIAHADSTTLGRELVGAAWLARARAAIARGEDPREMLAQVPDSVRATAAARHLLALAALEHGERDRGRALLGARAAMAPGGRDSREALLALAGQAMDDRRWADAESLYAAIATDRLAEHDTLSARLAHGGAAALWDDWLTGVASPAHLPIARAPFDTAAARFADAALDLGASPDPAAPAPDPAAVVTTLPWEIAPPDSGAWRTVFAATDAHDAARVELDRTRWAIAREQRDLAARRVFLAHGIDQAHDEATRLAERVAWLDSLRRRAADIDARLQAVRDAAARRIAERTHAVLATSDADSLWIAALRWYHLDGPHRDRPIVPPTGYPGPDTTLAAEDSLVAGITRLARNLAAAAPALLARSYSEDWRPALVGRLGSLDDDAHHALAWARSLGTTLDSCLAAASSSDTLRALTQRERGFAARLDTLERARLAARDRTARDAVTRTLASLEDEREGIDYGLAASSYAVAVGLARTLADSAGVDPGDAPDDSTTAARRAQAIGRMKDFLALHPGSEARGEMRFRLADLLIVDARQRFREAMTRHLAANHANPGTLPVLDVAPALALYRAILAEDPTFAHRDAVLFDAGMILADQADPGAETMFNDLVTHHADSPYVAQAWLRLGDIRFGQKRWEESAAMYARAATSNDPEIQAIASFKRGWSEYDRERWSDAADAFRTVLDVYASPARASLRADIEREAESYLIESLSRAGDGNATAAFLDRIGTRPYTQRLLMSLAQHERRYSHFDNAAALDSLTLERFALTPDALVSAQRLIATHERARHGNDARAARTGLAERFAPGSPWAEAQTSDSVRTTGASFAHEAWLEVASEYHLAARKSRDTLDWRGARDVYRALLARWPDSPDAPSLELRAGEVGLALGEYRDALAHDRAAASAANAPDTLVRRAMWQRVAALDAWYDASRSATHDTSAAHRGDATLAQGVIGAADSLRTRFPADTGLAGLTWRTGQLAWAHGWDERAIADFTTLATTWPTDPRSPDAAGLAADARFRAGRYAEAAVAYDRALAVARGAHREVLAHRLEQAIPVSEFRAAEAVVAHDSSAAKEYAPMFERVASRWPSFADADLARYRAGLAWLRASEVPQGVADLDTLVHEFPTGRYARDARLQIAGAWEKQGDRERAATAYLGYADAFPKEHDSGDALLKASDLVEAAGHADRAETLRLDYIRRHPEDETTAMAILEKSARRELAVATPAHPVSALLGKPPVHGKKAVAPTSHLADYLARARKRPELASRSLLGEVAFDLAAETDSAARAVPLRQPLAKSLVARQKLLDSTLVRYKRAIDVGSAEWAHAAAYRMGMALVAFGTALENSQPPADLKGDDLRAYHQVLRRKSAGFGERAEGVWSDMLRQQTAQKDGDHWTTEARTALWQRLGSRFTFHPETSYPLLPATTPEGRADSAPSDSGTGHGASASRHGSPEGDSP